MELAEIREVAQDMANTIGVSMSVFHRFGVLDYDVYVNGDENRPVFIEKITPEQ